MKKLVLLGLIAASITVRADQCDDHVAFASSGTVNVSAAIGASAQNGAVAYSVYNPFTCVSRGIAVAIKVIDPSGSNYYGFTLVGVNGNAVPGSIYATTGPLTGAVFTSVGASNVQTLWWVGGPITLPAGMYMLVMGTTCTSSCAQLFGDAALGHFYSFIYPNTAINTPWTFDSNGFSGFSTTNVPQVSMPLSSTATQTISGSTATVIASTIYVAHIYSGSVVNVQGVTTNGATAMNCTGCIVTAVNTSTGAITYRIPTAIPFSGTINPGATLAVSPIMVQQAKFVAPTALIF